MKSQLYLKLGVKVKSAVTKFKAKQFVKHYISIGSPYFASLLCVCVCVCKGEIEKESIEDVFSAFRSVVI